MICVQICSTGWLAGLKILDLCILLFVFPGLRNGLRKFSRLASLIESQHMIRDEATHVCP